MAERKGAAEQWARAARPNPGGRRCSTCQQPEAARAIREVLETWAGGEGEPTLWGLHAWLRETYAYRSSENSLKRHIRRCEEGLWQRIEERRDGRQAR